MRECVAVRRSGCGGSNNCVQSRQQRVGGQVYGAEEGRRDEGRKDEGRKRGGMAEGKHVVAANLEWFITRALLPMEQLERKGDIFKDTRKQLLPQEYS